MTTLVSFGCGLLFAIGLAVAGMTQPSKVMAFLDVGGAWDPSLALVMAAALAVIVVGRRFAPARPRFAAAYTTLSATAIDARLLVGAALFGIGWGLAGYCPGPALVSIGTATRGALIFVPAMIVGMVAQGYLLPKRNAGESCS